MDAGGRPFHIGRMVPHLLPREALSDRAGLVADIAKRNRIGAKLVNPLGPEEGVVWLAFQSTDLVARAINLDDGLGLHGAS